ncbi:MAG TPA: phosphatase PAP2 family protein [Lacunisphaera sp.]|nr:phosphatase PAP2 family protein [Lacunisphaera sp.]
MDSPDSLPSPAGWLRRCGPRIAVFWVPKMLGTTLGMTAFFIGYFWVLAHPQGPVTVMPLTFADRLIGFQPAALPLYLSLWFYVSLAPALVVDRRELLSYGAATAGLSLLGLGIFFLWPTAVPPAGIDWSLHPAFTFLKAADASGNACPSLHVAFSVFTAIWFARLLRELGAGPAARFLNWLWCGGILYSTVATRQHVALDVVAGGILGALVALAHLRWLRK